ncbi:nucleoside-diphosphate-sugar epimerase [Neofusicoccum parvum]|uniref:Nucleoside-diphosphate-sugar epimerase n=1 Tax=Neofusicoccum parvum TaxID=310453 RepID=A0ACB5SAX0_9PEZI|nr:nucleoside-diphosphate-sugar epimerase [Neofusicoccum parvum]
MPLARLCENITTPNVVCINDHASVLALPFSRDDGNTASVADFADTNATDHSFQLVRNSTFIVYDSRALDILGDTPSVEFVFEVAADKIHEAPVYVPELDAIIFSVFSPDVYPQSIIYLNHTNPRLETFYSSPPVWGINGGRYYNGKVYWAVAGDGSFPGPNNETVEQAPGIYTFDPTNFKSEALLNNYYGSKFNSPDDLVIDGNGDVFFTDPWFGWAMGFSTNPVMRTATWRFSPSTGAATVVENTLDQPNGIAISPNGKTLYVTDSGVTIESNSFSGIVYNSTNEHCTYAFSVNESPAGSWLSDKRPIWCTQSLGHDGLHVASNGYLVGASGTGVDVLSEWGELLLRIEANHTVNNVQFAGANLDELWLFGQGGISKVNWNLKGIAGARS